jgi:branched-chain amino acid transport system substrate-binding protein
VIKGARNENENVRKRKKIIIQKGGVAMKSKLGSFIISLIAVFLLVFAYHPFTNQAAAKEPVKIGVITPLSPPGDPAAGQLISRGAKFGAKYVNEEMKGVLGGRPIELVIEDDSGTPEKGVAAFRKLATKDKVIAVMGQYHSSVCTALVDVGAEYGIPTFSTGASASIITEKHQVTTFKTHVIDYDRASTWMDFFMNRRWKRIAVLAENTDYGVGLFEATKQIKEERGLKDVEINGMVFDRKVADLTPELLKLKAWKPDILLNIGVGDPTYRITKQAFDLGFFPQVPMMGAHDWPARPEFWKNLGKMGQYLMFINYYHPKMGLSQIGEWLKPRFEKEYGEIPTYMAYNGFGQIVLLAQAINQAKSDDPKDLIKSLEDGSFGFWAKGDVVRFKRLPGARWHNHTSPLQVVQFTKVDQPIEESTILWPPNMKTGEFVSP